MRVEPPGKLLLGLGTGVVFGGLLQKGQAAKHAVIIDQLLMKDHTVAKIMGTAIVVGAAGVHALEQGGHVELDVKPMQVGGLVAGAVTFGAGLALLGYCPGTTLAAVGEGRRDALAGTLGMLAGAAVFVRAYPRLKPLIEAGDQGKVTLPGATKTSPWSWIAGLGVLAALGAALSRR